MENSNKNAFFEFKAYQMKLQKRGSFNCSDPPENYPAWGILPPKTSW
jgi:hypothetical protein